MVFAYQSRLEGVILCVAAACLAQHSGLHHTLCLTACPSLCVSALPQHHLCPQPTVLPTTVCTHHSMSCHFIPCLQNDTPPSAEGRLTTFVFSEFLRVGDVSGLLRFGPQFPLDLQAFLKVGRGLPARGTAAVLRFVCFLV